MAAMKETKDEDQKSFDPARQLFRFFFFFLSSYRSQVFRHSELNKDEGKKGLRGICMLKTWQRMCWGEG